MGVAVFVLFWDILKPYMHSRLLSFIGLLTLVFFVPTSGILDTEIYSFSHAFSRYLVAFRAFYPFAAVCVACGIALVHKRLVDRHRTIRFHELIESQHAECPFELMASKTLSSQSWRVSQRDEVWLESRIEPIRRAIEYVPTGKKLIMDNTALNYYLDNKAVVLFSRPTWKLVQAKDEEQVKTALAELDAIGLILLNRSIPGFLDKSPLFDFINKPEYATLFSHNNIYSVYMLVEPPNYETSEVAYTLIDQLDKAYIISPDNNRHVHRSSFIIDYVPKRIIFAHPPAQISYRIQIPTNMRLDFFSNISPEVWKLGTGDGVQFNVNLDDGQGFQTIFSTYLDPKNIIDQRHWVESSVDLGDWAGQTITITLSTECGPNNNCDYDWAGWGEPRLVQPVVYKFIEQYPTAQVIETDPGNVYTETLTIDYETRPIIFQHPTSRQI